jgi:PAS domain S-box-containing protein
LRDEITVAYEGMEERVRERTADLEETTSRLAEENEERLKSDARTRLILNSAGEGIFGVDAKERVTFLNDAAVALLGYAADELIGQEIHGIIHHSYSDGTPYPKKDCPMFQACTQGGERHISGEALWRKDGTQFLSEYSATPISDDKDGLAGAVIVFRDITERKRNEDELKLRMEEMERFNRLVTGREERMIQLKGEINMLLEEMGKERKYKTEA